jgi:hypothetical protein
MLRRKLEMTITKEQGIKWCQDRLGQRIDFDGYYGSQCMDLTVAFCSTNFGWKPSGNAINLITQAIPSG